VIPAERNQEPNLQFTDGELHMIYEITGIPDQCKEVIDEVYEDPRAAKADRDYLKQRVPSADFEILEDGRKMTEQELVAAIGSYEIRETANQASRLPPTYRRGWGSERDDFSQEFGGEPKRVWRPVNPEDEHG
jgi:hypothetical protein